jgi:hypothetical protein
LRYNGVWIDEVSGERRVSWLKIINVIIIVLTVGRFGFAFHVDAKLLESDCSRFVDGGGVLSDGRGNSI